MINEKNLFCVLLSTYNGEKYLYDLLKSLEDQDIPINLFVRDDGSIDKTRDILNEFAQTREWVTLIFGENIGVIKSFFTLLQVSTQFSYYAFCDQDDIWLSDKISRAYNFLKEYPSTSPNLYFSRLTAVNGSLEFIREGRNFHCTFIQCVFKNYAPGCTMVINSKAREFLLKYNFLEIRMHDWWILQVLNGVGNVVFDNESRLLYRIHDSNTVGINKNTITKWCKRFSRFSYHKYHYIIQQAKLLLHHYGNELHPDNRIILAEFIAAYEGSLVYKLKFCLKPYRIGSNKTEEMLFRLMIIFRLL